MWSTESASLTSLMRDPGCGKTVIRPPSYYNWWAGQPDGGGSSNCVLKTWFWDGNGQWFDHDCNVDYADEHGPIHALCQADQ